MTPSPYQAASKHSSLTPSDSERDARRASTDWPYDTTSAAPPSPATPSPVLGSSGEPVLGVRVAGSTAASDAQPDAQPKSDAATKFALEYNHFTEVARQLRRDLVPAKSFKLRCQQAFDIANDLFGNAPTWVCFYRELLAPRGMLHTLFAADDDLEEFHGSDQYQQIQGMLTALRSRDLPESDPQDPLRMITVRLPKSLHEAMCDEAKLLNISINKLCISRILQLLDPDMVPEPTSKPRGRKPRTRSEDAPVGEPPSATPASQASMQQPVPPQHRDDTDHPAGGDHSRGADLTSHIRRP